MPRITVSIKEEIDRLGSNQFLPNGKFLPNSSKIKSPKSYWEESSVLQSFLRNSTAFVSYKDLKHVMKELKGIYGADNAEETGNRLEDFAESELGKRYSVIKQMWQSQWDQVIPLFNFPLEIRKLIYTTNSIEALDRSIRRVIKTRTMFPTDDSVYKLVYLAKKNATNDWSKSVFRWRQAMLQFVVMEIGLSMDKMVEQAKTPKGQFNFNLSSNISSR